jgi:hypothetical protein
VVRQLPWVVVGRAFSLNQHPVHIELLLNLLNFVDFSLVQLFQIEHPQAVFATFPDVVPTVDVQTTNI